MGNTTSRQMGRADMTFFSSAPSYGTVVPAAPAEQEIMAIYDQVIRLIKDLRETYDEIITKPEKERVRYLKIVRLYQQACWLPAKLRGYEEALRAQKNAIAIANFTPEQLKKEKFEIELDRLHWSLMNETIQVTRSAIESPPPASDLPDHPLARPDC